MEGEGKGRGRKQEEMRGRGSKGRREKRQGGKKVVPLIFKNYVVASVSLYVTSVWRWTAKPKPFSKETFSLARFCEYKARQSSPLAVTSWWLGLSTHRRQAPLQLRSTFNFLLTCPRLLVKISTRMYHTWGTGGRCCYTSARQTLCVHLPSGSTFLRETTSSLPLWNYEIRSEIRLRQSMGI